jgi:hypothetical protein
VGFRIRMRPLVQVQPGPARVEVSGLRPCTARTALTRRRTGGRSLRLARFSPAAGQGRWS